MTSNIPLGTYFQDGVRTGPIFTNQLPASLTANINGVITSNDYSTYGPGALLSTQNTYNITPAIPNPVGFTQSTNIVAQTAIGAVPGAMYLTLLGDNSATFYTTGANGLPLIQFDWPRVPGVTIYSADATPNTHVTIFGYDYYGFPLQHTYIVGAIGAYPTVVDGAGAVDGKLTYPDGITPLPCKAFYQVTGIYVSAALPGNCLIGVGAYDIFGLPYVVKSKGVITSIQWGTQAGGGYPNANPIVPVSELTTRVIGAPLTTTGIFVPADTTNPSTSITGDVRGLYAPSSDASAQTIATVNVDYKNLIFTTYVKGEDNWINQVASAQQQYMQQTGSATPQGVPIAPQVAANTYGVPQFYTGVPT
jgi:hypothetical protein